MESTAGSTWLGKMESPFCTYITHFKYYKGRGYKDRDMGIFKLYDLNNLTSCQSMLKFLAERPPVLTYLWQL